ncbi:hypothetical protein QAD02_001496 [Eretmocerus hayati]|uniref:Uncharacterized protein n=1 Tax=Eretmocerus hayati TaxID=131215 RepID=A0ACC2NGL7_9HYME|nr:hypothetical protein QAD02_001496 [Eretmocerus hayati]
MEKLKKFKASKPTNSAHEVKQCEIESSSACDIQKSGYEKFFKYRESDAVCLLCEEKKSQKIILRTGGNTTGLKKHLKATHPDQFAEIFGNQKPSQQKHWINTLW